MFPLTKKIGMINLWRNRCNEHHRVCGKAVNAEDCKICDALAKEICDDITSQASENAFKKET
jgi:hypothetical protein